MRRNGTVPPPKANLTAQSGSEGDLTQQPTQRRGWDLTQPSGRGDALRASFWLDGLYPAVPMGRGTMLKNNVEFAGNLDNHGFR